MERVDDNAFGMKFVSESIIGGSALTSYNVFLKPMFTSLNGASDC